MSKKFSPIWKWVGNYDADEVNPQYGPLVEERRDRQVRTSKLLRRKLNEHYDAASRSTNPYSGRHLAIVLKVLTGPSAYNDASTGGNLSKSMRLSGQEDIEERSSSSLRHDPPVRVLAHVRGIDDALVAHVGGLENLDSDDEFTIGLHGQYEAVGLPSTEAQKISVNSIIQIEFNPRPTGASGKPSGIIVGVIEDTPIPHLEEVKKSALDKFKPPECKQPRIDEGPGPGLFVGSTVSDIKSDLPIRKVKGKIKTGFYGNGTAQTKEHFDAALNLSAPSPVHKIPGRAPGPNNAFIWAGHLKNNGYLDLLDRPLSLGRETIIYASKFLDLSAPIEIKYYFHDVGGFGHAWVNGPNTTTAQARDAATTPEPNDFRDILGPGIKDLIKEGRNFVLVIPEMMYSRGFGTMAHDGGANRLSGLLTGANIGAGISHSPPDINLVRVHPEGIQNEKLLSVIRQYLDDIPISVGYKEGLGGTDLFEDPGFTPTETFLNESVLSVTRLREREFSTFDGSFTGGNFGLFHEEVVGVLNEHLGNVRDKISYISILADGLGGVNFASMVQRISNSPSHSRAETGVRNVDINRVDFIDSGMDNDSYHLFPSIPSYTIYEDYLLFKTEDLTQTIEFNYVTPFTSVNPGAKKFFNKIGLGEKFSQTYKASGAPGEQKFSALVDGASLSRNSVNLFVTNTSPWPPAGYVMSMKNTFLKDITLPQKSISRAGEQPGAGTMPNHAQALAAKRGNAAKAIYSKELILLNAVISSFEEFLYDFAAQGNPTGTFFGHGGDNLCTLEINNERPYAVYCNDKEKLVFHSGSPLEARYKKYLNARKRYYELSTLSAHQDVINNVGSDKELVEAALKGFEEALTATEQTIEDFNHEELWKNYNQAFGVYHFNTLEKLQISIGIAGNAESHGHLGDVARSIGIKSALQKTISVLKEELKTAKPSGRDPECVVNPFSLRSLNAGGYPDPSLLSTDMSESLGIINCKSKIPVPENYSDLAKLIPFFPKKSEMLTSSNASKNKTGILNAGIGYKTGTFRYKARGPDNTVVNLRSPPVWNCLAPILEKAWSAACAQSNYVPFRIMEGIKGAAGRGGVTAYKSGLSLYSLGLALSVDPFINGYSAGDPFFSAWTGMWSPDIDKHREELERLGVWRGRKYWDGPWYNPTVGFDFGTTSDNVYEDFFGFGRRLRQAEEWDDLFDTDGYRKTEDSYEDVMEFADGSTIVPVGANPTLWMLTFCELSGMKWGNSFFMKRRWRGGNIWSPAEQRRIDAIYGIKDVVARVNAVSWSDANIDDHMHFHFWSGESLGGRLIKWDDIEEVAAEYGQ